MAMGGEAFSTSVAASRGRADLVAWLLPATRRMLIVWLLLAGVMVAGRTLASTVPPRLAPLLISAVMLAAAAWFARAWPGLRTTPRKRATVYVAEFVRILAVTWWHGPTSHEVGYPRVVQQFKRTLSADGQEAIEGSVAVIVERGSKTGTAHVGFCPPLAAQPHFELRPANARGVVLKVGQLLPQGVRIEAKLPAPAEAARILSVQFVARSRSDAHGPMAV